MTAPPKRRWFRFSLRTLFVVVTIFGVWLGWQLSIVRERTSLIKELETNYPSHVAECIRLEGANADPGWFDRVNGRYIKVSALRRLLGDESILEIDMSDIVDLKLVDRIERAFPEAELSIWGSDNVFLKASRASLRLPLADREPNEGTIFKTGLIEK